MAIYKQGEITKNEIGKLYLQGEAVKSQVGKVYEFDGTINRLIYTAEAKYSGYRVPTLYPYGGGTVVGNSSAIDASGFDNISFSWSNYFLMTWSNSNGNTAFYTINLLFADGSTILIRNGNRGGFFQAGTQAWENGNANINISLKTNTQKSKVSLQLIASTEGDSGRRIEQALSSGEVTLS